MRLPRVDIKGKHGDWFAEVEGFGRLTCLHFDFCKLPDRYDQPKNPNDKDERGKALLAQQVEALNRDRLFVITLDTWDRICHRDGYVGVYELASDAVLVNGRLQFRYGRCVAEPKIKPRRQ